MAKKSDENLITKQVTSKASALEDNELMANNLFLKSRVQKSYIQDARHAH